MEHKNNIYIKLLPNRRFIYSNRRQNIVITAEHSATEITVLYPEEYENDSKRVDFVNSKGKEWTEALYIPEYKSYPPEFDKNRFHFTLPTEVTTEGELKMQFIAYKPDESMTTVPFEVIPIDVLEGVLAFKKHARSNPDLLILSYNQSTEALFNSQRAVAKSEKAGEQSQEAVEKANHTEENIATEVDRATAAENNLQVALEEEIERAQNAESVLAATLDAEVERATQAEADITASLENETAERIAGDNENAAATAAERARAQSAESALAASLATETARAQAVEQTIAQAIAAETERAVAAESDLTVALSHESVARIRDDEANAAAVQSESARAQAAEFAIASDLASETARSQTAESHLQAAITAEQTRAQSAENNLQSSITTEAARAIGAEAELRADFNAEVTRAQTAEQQNTTAIVAEGIRATQAEAALGARIDLEIPAAVSEAKQYTNQVAEQVRIDGTIYKGTVDEGNLPTTGNENGDLYWISDFTMTHPEHSGSAIFNGATNTWDFNIDHYQHQDNETIVARDSDGALKVADTDEINLTPDTADFGLTVQLGFKSVVRTLVRKIKGLFQKSAENSAAITTETSRAQTAESGLSTSIAAEVTRATAAEQVNASAIQAEAIRAQTTEAGKVDKAAGKGLSTEDYTTAEKNKLAGIAAGAQANVKANWSETNAASDAYLQNKPTSMPASDVPAWAKAANKPTYAASEVGAEPAFSKNTAFNQNFGSAAGTVCEGNDNRLSNARMPTSHATATTTYGAGDAANYGHVKLSSVHGATPLPTGDTALKYNYSTAASDIDLNTFVYEGRFTLYNVPTAITDAANNFPTGWNTGNPNYNTAYLEVRRFYHSTEIHQTLYKRRTTERWVRVLTSSIWSAWREVDSASAEIALTFSHLAAGVSSISGHYVKESATHGRIFLRFTLSTSIAYWTHFARITNEDIPSGVTVGNRLGMVTTMGGGAFNGTTMHTVCLNLNNDIMTGATLNANEYTALIFV